MTFGSLSKNAQTAVILFSFLIIAGAQDFLRGITSGSTALVELPPKYYGLSIDAAVVKNLLGTRLMVSDLLWVDTLVKADVTKEPMPFGEFYRAFNTVLELDPDNLYGYYVAGIYLSVIKDDFKGATKILKKGVDYLQATAKHYPQLLDTTNAWKVPFILGYNLAFEEQEFEEGGLWIHYAAGLSDAPKYVKDLDRMASTPYGRLELGSRVLADLHRRLTKDEEKKAVEAKMLKLSLMQEELVINTQFQDFINNTGVKKASDSVSAARAFQMFLKQNGRRGSDLLGRPFSIQILGDGSAKITNSSSNQ